MEWVDRMNLKPYESIKFSESPKPAGDEFSVLFLYEGSKHKDKLISRVMEKSKFSGKFSETLPLQEPMALLVGLGKPEQLSLETIRKCASIAARAFRSKQKKYSVCLPVIKDKDARKFPKAAVAQAIVEGTILGLYKFEEFKKEDGEGLSVESVSLVSTGIAAGMRNGRAVSLAAIMARELTNMPANIATPAYIAKCAAELAKKEGLGLKIFGHKKMKKIGMNAFVGVSQGSSQEPCFVVMEYNPQGVTGSELRKPKSAGSLYRTAVRRPCAHSVFPSPFGSRNPKLKTIVLVGKGITFDSGGISIKPSKNMDEMVGDKAGACAVLSVMLALPGLKPNYRVFGVLALSENMPSGSAQKPGDIVRASNGKSIEVLNTDAEGRLVLADAMAYVSRELKPDYAIDIATLTGGCTVALGRYASAILGNDQKLIDALIASGENVFERLWQLPLWDEYKDMVKSEFADVRNISIYNGEASTITGGAFISNFVGDLKWAHIDIASTSWSRESKFYTSSRATGVGTRLLLDFLKR
ncbi:hypothetical protein COS70_05315 [Candidatus Micrarchaeota archaeon CG06_land_8_20_14_3_00_50_6]|nr:MAG: hypothetical protein COS70_05315 [Candidatus Micrarchaeota archaeon CG06_land_8_20_14_3_00_50_6]